MRNSASTIALLVLTLQVAAAEDPATDHTPVENQLLEAIENIRGQRLDTALKQLSVLVQEQPDFKLAQLVYGDVLLARAQPIRYVGWVNGEDSDILNDLRDEARRRFNRHSDLPLDSSVPSSFLELAPEQKHAIAVDIGRSRLYLFENRDGHPVLVADYYAAGGKQGAGKQREGDQRTPVGVYFISSRLDSEELPDLYGAGALPINYPNAWDQRMGRTGHGIWLHGVPSGTYSRSPRSSDGCVTLANSDFVQLDGRIDVGTTPVVIGQSIDWSNGEAIRVASGELYGAIDEWRRDWERLDMARYASHYSRSFSSNGMGYDEWIADKTRINKSKSYVEIGISELSMLRDPSDPRLAVVSFVQDYKSNNYTGEARKRQYWYREFDGQWRIVFEVTL